MRATDSALLVRSCNFEKMLTSFSREDYGLNIYTEGLLRDNNEIRTNSKDTADVKMLRSWNLEKTF